MHIIKIFVDLIILLIADCSFTRAIYKFKGGITVFWYIIWIIFIYRNPSKDKFILPEEKRFIVENVAPLPEKVSSLSSISFH